MSTLGKEVILVTSNLTLSGRGRGIAGQPPGMRVNLGCAFKLTLGSSSVVVVERLIVEQSSEVTWFGSLERVQVVHFRERDTIQLTLECYKKPRPCPHRASFECTKPIRFDRS
jgi:hypothetical protein